MQPMQSKIAIIPRVHGVGGMVSFRDRFSAALKARGIETTCDVRGARCAAALVIGGTRDLLSLWRAKRRGVRVVQRIDGMNWLHRKQPTGLKHHLRAEYGNWNLNFIRAHLADHIVYQSEFARRWWERVYGEAPVPASVIHNAVDLQTCVPDPLSPDSQLPNYRLLLVEGSLAGGYEIGLESAIGLVERLNREHAAALGKAIELVVVGRVSEAIKARWARETDVPLIWAGLLPSDEVREHMRAAHLLYAADLNPACPNAVIEALACGLPVLAFDTGALPELITGDAGRVVPYGGDPWNLDPPDIDALTHAAMEILADLPRFRVAARARAEEAFDLDRMTDAYLEVLLL